MPEIFLHKSLYDAAAVHAVAAQYQGVATVAVEDGEHEVVVRFDQVDPDVVEVLVDHFGNHVLVETVRRHAGAEQTLLGDRS